MNTGKIFLGVLGGVVSGLLLGLFLAPDNNVVNRRKIVRDSKDFANDSKDRFNQFIDGIAGKSEPIKES
jgi:gas vesicle protein